MAKIVEWFLNHRITNYGSNKVNKLAIASLVVFLAFILASSAFIFSNYLGKGLFSKYKGSQGYWQELNVSSLKVKGDSLSAENPLYRISFSKDVIKPLIFTSGSGSIYFAPIISQRTGLNPVPTDSTNNVGAGFTPARVTKNKAVYKNVYPNTNLERIITPQGLKQNYILTKAGHPTSFSEKIKTNLAVKLQKEGSLSYMEGSAVIATSPKPHLTDAAGKVVQLSYALSRDKLSISLPSLKGLRYPITVDPSIIPVEGHSLIQYKADGLTEIPAGEGTNANSVVLKISNLKQLGSSTTLKAQFEVKEVGQAFDGTVIVDGDLSSPGGESSASITGLTVNKAYHWRARIVDSGTLTSRWFSYGNDLEDEADFYVDTIVPGQPGMPESLSPTTDTKPTWRWDKAADSLSGIKGYKVYVGTASGLSDIENGTLTTTSSFTHSTDLAYGTYYARVVAVDGAGNEGQQSLEGQVQIINIPDPLLTAPSGLTVSEVEGGGKEVNISWTAPLSGSVSYYNVYRGTHSIDESNKSLAMLLTKTASTQFLDSDKSKVGGRIYFYQVTAVDTNGIESPLSIQVINNGIKISELAGAWLLDEGIGTIAYDTAGSNNGDLSGSVPTWVAGKYGQALSFAGDTQQVLLPDAGYFGQGQQTLELWAKPKYNPPAAAGYLFSHPGASNNKVDIVQQTNGNISLYVGDATAYTILSSGEYSANEWLNIVITRDFANQKINAWVNGVQKITNQGVIIGSSSTAAPRIGSNGSAGFKGAIDEVKIYNRALTANEISQLYQSGYYLEESLIGELAQQKADGVNLPVAVGGSLSQNRVILKVINLKAFDNSAEAYAQFEVKPVSQPFDGIGLINGNTANISSASSALVENLSASESYHWRARLVDEQSRQTQWVSFGANSDGNPPTVSADVDFSVGSIGGLPTPPGMPSVLSPTTNTKPTWYWNPASGGVGGIKGYYVYIGTAPGLTNIVNGEFTANTYFKHQTALQEGTFYAYVVAVDFAGNLSLASGTGTLEVLTAASLAATKPAFLDVNQEAFPSRKANLSWKESPAGSANYYNVYRANARITDENLSSATLVAEEVKDLSFTDNNLQRGKTYYYQVTAVVGGVESQVSIKVVNDMVTIPSKAGFLWTTQQDFEGNASTTGDDTARVKLDTEITPGSVRLWSLTGAWRFDEGTGTIAYDSAGFNHGELLGVPTWVAGRYGQALSFDGLGDYVYLGNPSELRQTQNQTIAMWLKPDSFSQRSNPYDKAYGGEGAITQETNGTLNYYYGTAGGSASPYQTFNTNSAIQLNNWNHVAIVRDLTNMQLKWYINGNPVNQGAAQFSAATASDLSAQIGKGYAGNYSGLIDEVKIFNKALTGSEVSDLYNAVPVEGSLGFNGGVGLRAEAEKKVKWLSLDWTSDSDTGNIQFQVRTADTLDGLFLSTYVGPDGTSNTWFNSQNKQIPALVSPSKAIEIKFKLTDNSTFMPMLHSVYVSYEEVAAPGEGSLTQHKEDGTPIAVGEKISGTKVKLRVSGIDIFSGKAQFELKTTDKPFDGQGLVEGGIQSGGISEALIGNLEPGKAYYWRARIVDSQSNVESDWASFGGNLEGSPPQRKAQADFIIDAGITLPTNLDVVASPYPEQEANLTWSAPQAGATAYNIYRFSEEITDANFSQASKIATIGGTAYTDDTVSRGQTYYYQVTAIDGGNNESGLSVLVKNSRVTIPIKEAGEPYKSAHRDYSVFSDLCRNCHVPHKAEGDKKLFKEAGEQVCFTCHDGSGSSFNIRTTFKGKAAHDTHLAAPSDTGIKCTLCHQPHGATNYLGKGSGGWLTKDLDEKLCFTCHNDKGNSVNNWNIKEQFNRISTHTLTGTTRDGLEGVSLKCSNCHNPHVSERGTGGVFADIRRLINPANTTEEWTGSITGFCLECHKSSDLPQKQQVEKFVPYNVRFPDVLSSLSPFFGGWDKTSYGQSAHGENVNGQERFQCNKCHQPHGSPNQRLNALFIGDGQQFQWPTPANTAVEFNADTVTFSSGTVPYAPPAGTGKFGKDGTGVSFRAFLRFNINIPRGSVINSASIKNLVSQTDSAASFQSYIRLIDADDAPNFIIDPWPLPVTGNVNWPVSSWLTGSAYQTADITGLVQQYINRDGYESGKYIGIRIDEGTALVSQIKDFGGTLIKLAVNYDNTQSTSSPNPVSDAGAYDFRAREETLCFQCHYAGNTMGAPDILTPFTTSTYTHNKIWDEDKHSDTESSAGLGSANRHSECSDCHDPHKAKSGNRSFGSNLAGGPIQGVKGVGVTNGAAGQVPQFYSTLITYEYELCFKCHSSYSTGYTGSDKAVEFNPNNPSYHPVEAVGKNLGIEDSAFVPGTPWNPNSGDDADYGLTGNIGDAGVQADPNYPGTTSCTDCHNNSEPGAKGPHGSNNAKILQKPVTPGLPLETTSGSSVVGPTELCFSCHAYDVYVNGSAGSRFPKHQYHVQNQRISCGTCHSTHGESSRVHLIGGTAQITIFSNTSSGGFCAPICHSEKSYFHNYPEF